jgi:hypothetical protein
MKKTMRPKAGRGGSTGGVNRRTVGGAPKSQPMLPRPAKTPRGLGPARK